MKQIHFGFIITFCTAQVSIKLTTKPAPSRSCHNFTVTFWSIYNDADGPKKYLTENNKFCLSVDAWMWRIYTSVRSGVIHCRISYGQICIGQHVLCFVEDVSLSWYCRCIFGTTITDFPPNFGCCTQEAIGNTNYRFFVFRSFDELTFYNCNKYTVVR